ncbi:MAG: hypothetical protein FGF51_04375 [Candidatus Brockarchaeota archaeon]|nr:hypothetical protein [Candidatus Brockarchaeota archaeon]
MLKKLAKISRGVFNPTVIREEPGKWKDRIPCLELNSPGWKGDYYRVYFEFKGEEYFIDFCFLKNLLVMSFAILKINELIKDTGYQYYLVMEPLMQGY